MKEILLWATRGRSWGFRFLRQPDLPELAAFELHRLAFSDETPCGEFVKHKTFPLRDGRLLTCIVARFLDPEGRTDSAGRVIPHELVLSDRGRLFRTTDDVVALIWPELSYQYKGSYPLKLDRLGATEPGKPGSPSISEGPSIVGRDEKAGPEGPVLSLVILFLLAGLGSLAGLGRCPSRTEIDAAQPTITEPRDEPLRPREAPIAVSTSEVSTSSTPIQTVTEVHLLHRSNGKDTEHE